MSILFSVLKFFGWFIVVGWAFCLLWLVRLYIDYRSAENSYWETHPLDYEDYMDFLNSQDSRKEAES